MTKQEIIQQLKAQIKIAEKEFRGSKMLYVLKDAMQLIDKQECMINGSEISKLEKKLRVCEMNKEILKNQLEAKK